MRKYKSMLTDDALALLARLGQNIDIARKRRRLTIEAIAGRCGTTPQTYRRLAQGDPGVTLGVLAAALTALDMESSLGLIADPSSDSVGVALEHARLPKRIHAEPENELDTDF